MRYAIPAILRLVLWIPAIAITLVLWIASGFSSPNLIPLLNQTAAGRIMTNLMQPEL